MFFDFKVTNNFPLYPLICLFSASTTYTTTMYTTENNPPLQCQGCPKNDTIILPKYINLPITYIKSGKWEDCMELCQLIYNNQPFSFAYHANNCYYFNFYSSEFDGDLKNYCNLFSEIRDRDGNSIKQSPMKGVISGALESLQSKGK